MALRRTKTFKAASRPSYVSRLGLPTSWVLGLMGAIAFTMMFVHNWHWWPVLIALCVAVGIAVAVAVRRDHNALRRLGLGIKTKLLSPDSHIWRGHAVSSFPSLPHKEKRGVRRAS
jgi:type IV secretory pathway VirB3-like protein